MADVEVTDAVINVEDWNVDRLRVVVMISVGK